MNRESTQEGSRWRDELEVETRATRGFEKGVEEARPRVPGLTVLFHPDVRRVGDRIALPQLPALRSVSLSRVTPEFFPPQGAKGRPLVDSHLSRTPILLQGISGGGVAIERGEHRGEVRVDGQALESRHSLGTEDLTRGVPLLLTHHVLLWLHWVDPVPVEGPDFDLVGESPAMGRLRQEIRRAASLDVTVLLRGESGTGKELVAKAVHGASGRRSCPYVSLNMAAVPPSLAASELFGVAKGAFTGATPRQGFFERAQGGCLFLDEIGETPPELQALLLRCLENHEIQPVGAVGTRSVDVRVLAATDADLDRAIDEGRFRLPLLHRLAGYEIRLPPLRERRDDIPRLLVHFLKQELVQLGAEGAGRLESPSWWSARRMAELVAHDWPGNVRELRNMARRIALGGDTELQRPSYDGATSRTATACDGESSSVSPPLSSSDQPAEVPTSGRIRYRKPSEISEEELLTTLREQRWRLKPSAEALGVSRASLYLMIEGCGKIRKAVDLSRREIIEALERADGDLASTAALLEVSEQGLKRRMKSLGLR